MTTRDEAGSKASAQAVLPSTSIRTSQQSIVTQFMDLRKVRLLTTEEEQLFREAMNALNEEKKLLEEQKNQDKICKEERKEQEKICQEECKEQELACKERGEIRASTVQLVQETPPQIKLLNLRALKQSLQSENRCRPCFVGT